MPPYGVVVVGPPGAGKSTLCAGLARYLELLRRPCAVVNLDPGCEGPHRTPCHVDVRNVCRVEDVMRSEQLGPNGALTYCVRLLRDSKWLVGRIEQLRQSSSDDDDDDDDDDDAWPYLIMDLPGQAELWSHSDDLRAILADVTTTLDARLVVAHVVDARHCTRPTTFLAAALLSLNAMLRLALPHVNVLTKVDQLHEFEADLPFKLDYFADATQLHRLVPYCGHPSGGSGVPWLCTRDDESPPSNDARRRDAVVRKKTADDSDDHDDHDDDDARRGAGGLPGGLQRLSARVCEVVEDFNLVCFQPLDISDGESVAALTRLLDKAVGHPAATHDHPPDLVDDPARLFLAAEAAPRGDGKAPSSAAAAAAAATSDDDDAFFRRRAGAVLPDATGAAVPGVDFAPAARVRRRPLQENHAGPPRPSNDENRRTTPSPAPVMSSCGGPTGSRSSSSTPGTT